MKPPAAAHLLITDYKDNLSDLFEIGKEIVVYRSAEECAALVNYYLSRPQEAEAIARAGQARTLRDHSYKMNMAELSLIFKRHLRYQTEMARLPVVAADKVSYGKEGIAERQIKKKYLSAWKSGSHSRPSARTGAAGVIPDVCRRYSAAL